MWRRRRLMNTPTGPGKVPPGPLLSRIEKAHQLLQLGQNAEAAAIFEELARGAQIRDPNRAPQFYLQAARAHLLNKEIDSAMRFIYHSLGLHVSENRWIRLTRSGKMAIAELLDAGYKTQAAELENWLANATKNQDEQESIAPQDHPSLPAHCTSCGGALRPAEVEWLESSTAECPYCGSPIHIEVSK